MNRSLLAFLALSFFGVAAAGILLKGASDESSSVFTIETAAVERGNVARLVSSSGEVRALTTVEVGTQVSGQIVELLADYNSEVSANQIIAKIDPQTFEASVASSRADVVSAQANLDVQRATIERNEATVLTAEKAFARNKSLYEQDAIALALLEDVERELAVARAELNVSKAQLRTAEATLTQRQAALKNDLVDLERSVIRSPIDGVVISRDVDIGQTVQASFSAPVLFTIAQDLGDIRIDADVVEADIAGINTGDPATFTVDAYPDQTFRGAVEQVRLASETISNVVTYTVVIAAQNRNGQLLPGMTANVEITAEQREDVMRLPEAVSRFRPPNNGPEVVSLDDGESSGRAGERPRRGNPTSALLNELNIEESRRTEIEEAIQESLSDMRADSAQAGPRFDRNAFRQQMQARIDIILKNRLSSDEYKQIQAAQVARQSQRTAELYITTEDGLLTQRRVRVGLSDGEFIEIVGGAEIGDSFVTRVVANSEGR